MKSILSNEKCCYICGTTLNLQKHHIFEGWGRRKASDKQGCWVWLCAYHHGGNNGVHFNRTLDLRLKRECQRKWQELYGSTEDFIRQYDRSYL